MPHRERHDTSPFLEHTPSSPWRLRAKDFRRRPLLTKQIACLAVALALSMPLWLLVYRGHDSAHPAAVAEGPYSNAAFHWSRPSSTQAAAGIPSAVPEHAGAQKMPARPHKGITVPAVSSAVDAAPDPPTFSFIMFSEDSAAEGAVLIKSIILYSSGPVHFHIICDEAAQLYLEHRLALVKRPMYNILVRFYRTTHADMAGRLDREGAINTDHSAGAPGLMKLFIHEILPDTVKRSVFIDTDAFFISNPLLLWQQFDRFTADTAISMPSHPEQSSAEWHNANRICSCIMLLDLERLRALRLMDSAAYRRAGAAALAPAAFTAMFGPPGADGRYRGVKLGDQGYWWAIVSHRPDLFVHLSYDWEVSSCLLDMYYTGLGHDDAPPDAELASQVHTLGTPHEGQVVLPKMLHFNCLDGTPHYYEWKGWSDPENSLTRRWKPAVDYHVGFKWLWLNHAQTNDTKITLETVNDVKFADERYASNTVDTV